MWPPRYLQNDADTMRFGEAIPNATDEPNLSLPARIPFRVVLEISSGPGRGPGALPAVEGGITVAGAAGS